MAMRAGAVLFITALTAAAAQVSVPLPFTQVPFTFQPTVVLLGGLALGKPLLAMVFDSVFDLTPEGWRKLTWRWALFFLALAALNEIVWRTQTTDAWVSFKVFGVVPLTFVFMASQYPLLMRYAKAAKAEARTPEKP